MQKYSKIRYSLKSPERRTSLGLQTCASFELQLLEVAVRGRKVFENSWNGQATIHEQVMFLEILEELRLLEKVGCDKLLVERARNLVVRMKDHRSFHQRALVVYRDILCLSNSRTGTNSSLQQREEWGRDAPGSLIPHRNTESSSSESITLDEKFDEVMNLEFPDSDDDDSSMSIEFFLRATRGEPGQIFCEQTEKFNEVSVERLSIFKKPTMIDEAFATPFDFTPDELSETDSNAENFSDEDPTSNQESRRIPGIQLCLGDEPPPQSLLEETIEQKESKELSDTGGADEKIDFVDVQVPQLLGSFRERDFKFPISWTVDGATYRAKSIADLRSKHNVLIEGAFRKRCR